MKRATRFEPDPLDHALVDFRGDKDSFSPTAVALILNESYTGCSLLIKTTLSLKKDQILTLKVGRLDPLQAKVAWGQQLEDSLFKVGVQFLE